MPEPHTQQILPPPRKPREPRPSDGIHVTEANPEQFELSDEVPPELAFDPIAHAPKTGVKFTPERQRKFINALAACGSVTISAAAVDMSTGQVYHLRQRAGAESFAASWDKAVERGALRVRDVLVDQAINGIPEYVYGPDGKVLIERRRFNTRMMMWIVAHHLPEKYGVPGGLMHSNGTPMNMKRVRDRWRQEWQREQMEDQQARHHGAIESVETKINAIRHAFKQNLADDPEKRAAWELLTGPTDWSDFNKLPDYGWNLPKTNQNRPDMIVANAMGMDAMWGMRGGGDEEGEAPDAEGG